MKSGHDAGLTTETATIMRSLHNELLRQMLGLNLGVISNGIREA